MTIFERNPKPVNRRFAARVVAALVALLVSGCMKNYGRFTLDDQVSQAFRSGSIQTDYQYYYSGRQTMPYAIMAIDRRYSVPSKFWVPFEPDPEQLKTMSGSIFDQNRYPSYGYRILDPNGVVIGIWYASARDHSVRVDQENRTVTVLFTNPENDNHPSFFRGGGNTNAVSAFSTDMKKAT